MKKNERGFPPFVALGIEIVEHYIIALHYSTTLDDKIDIINRILRPAAKWYCRYLEAEDKGLFEIN